jgi:hypothetical protein
MAYCAASKRHTKIVNILTDIAPVLVRPGDVGIKARHGGKHDWYTNPKMKMSQPVPRHNEINEHLAKHILKKLGG